MANLQITSHIFIDDSELIESFIRASGPGGQNVNKVSSAVQLRFDLGATKALREDIKARVRKAAGHRLTKTDHIVITVDSHRTQKANRLEARRRLAKLLKDAVPVPIARKKTKPTKASVRRRLLAKKQRSVLKNNRSRVSPD